MTPMMIMMILILQRKFRHRCATCSAFVLVKHSFLVNLLTLARRSNPFERSYQAPRAAPMTWTDDDDTTADEGPPIEHMVSFGITIDVVVDAIHIKSCLQLTGTVRLRF